MASQNQRTMEGVVLTEQPEVHGQTEDSSLAPVHQPLMCEEPGIRDIDTHLQQRMRRSYVPAVPHFKMDREAHEDMWTITEVQVKGNVDSSASSGRTHGDVKKVCMHFGACIGCHRVTSLETTCPCGGEVRMPRMCCNEFLQ